MRVNYLGNMALSPRRYVGGPPYRSMQEKEGVTKYELHYVAGPAIKYDGLAELNAWRKLLHTLGLIGADPKRYGGVGFGNVSVRVPPFAALPGARHFLVTGTQTGGKPELTASDYALVTEYDPGCNRLMARGPVAPSSEALTHGMLYDLDDALRVVLHVHSPDIWSRARPLGIVATAAQAAYGTPEMTVEVTRLFEEGAVRRSRVFVMGGHEDGVVAFGRTADEAGGALYRQLTRAFILSTSAP